jgi:predicted DNA-binding transcriptional regulator YafY
MNKLERLLLLINLLYHRKRVPLKTILEVCDISQRTAFRYIQTISAANIPIYYDKHLKGYTLAGKSAVWVNSLRDDEILLIVFALKHISRRVNLSYQKAINSLIKRLASLQTFKLEEFLIAINSAIDDNLNKPDISKVLTSLLIQLAIASGKDLRLTITDEGTGEKEIRINNPRLLFKNDWKLVEKQTDATRLALLKDVVRVTLP